jgi:hypothetical protein
MMPLRVLHCPWMVGGNPAGLAAAERELGLESATIVFRPSPFGYPGNMAIWKESDGPVVREVKRWHLVVRALRDFDVVHFNFGTPIAPEPGLDAESPHRGRARVYRAYARLFEQFDLRLLARMGKAIFVTFQGSDARQRDIVSTFSGSDALRGAMELFTPESDRDKRRRIARFERYADGIYALNPDLLRVLPARARFVPYVSVDPRQWQPAPSSNRQGPPLVLHAPTNRNIKGTGFVLDAVSRLKAEGVELEFRLVEGLTQTEARALYAKADLVVDQLLVGWYGALAVEAMALEKPVVAYLGSADLEFIPSGMRSEIPVISAEPSTIYDVLRELLTTRRGELPELGRRSRVFVERWHDPLRIAEEIVADYEAAVARRRQRSGVASRHKFSRARCRSGRSSGSGSASARRAD